MKHKAKPAKGSARTKRFDVGGTVGALAGLGTLAYLMSRKKKGEAGKVDEAAKRRAMAASAGRPEMGDATNDNIVVNESAPSKRDKPAPTVIKNKKTEPPKTTTPTVKDFTEPGSGHAKEIKDKFAKFDPDPNKGKYKDTRADAIKGALPGKKPYTDSSGVVYNERGEPYANTTAKADATPMRPSGKEIKDIKAKQAATTGAKRTRYAKKKVEEPKRNTKPKRTRYAKKQVTDKKYSSGGSVSSASKRADGIAIRGKTRA